MKSASFYNSDPWLNPFTRVIDNRIAKCLSKEKQLDRKRVLLTILPWAIIIMACTSLKDSWIFREWAPNATSIFVTGTFTDWKEKQEFMMNRINQNGDWELITARSSLKHGDLYQTFCSLGRRKRRTNSVICKPGCTG